MATEWRPSASLEMLAARAGVLHNIRQFMSERGILEVETPVLGRAEDSDPHIRNLATCFHHPGLAEPIMLNLQSSPEFAMKRLLAAGTGPIYQITRVFRDNESGRLHNPEFTLLEWYRPGFDHHALMAEVDELIQKLGFSPTARSGYGSLFKQYAGIDPHVADPEELQKFAKEAGLNSGDEDESLCMDFIFAMKVAPHLGHDRPLLVYDYPACQCSLATLSRDNPPVAERFELFIRGFEIANGYNELCDADELKHRFERMARKRKTRGKMSQLLDMRFLDAVANGLPHCAGVAVGVDRLLMARHGCKDIREVIAFPVEKA